MREGEEERRKEKKNGGKLILDSLFLSQLRSSLTSSLCRSCSRRAARSATALWIGFGERRERERKRERFEYGEFVAVFFFESSERDEENSERARSLSYLSMPAIL